MGRIWRKKSCWPTTETKQEQAGVNEFENSQIRLSDGTLFFSTNAFNTGGQVDKANYHLLDLNAGFKYRGWSLEGEYYKRHLDHFETTGLIPVTQVDDDGFQLQASTMLIPKRFSSISRTPGSTAITEIPGTPASA